MIRFSSYDDPANSQNKKKFLVPVVLLILSPGRKKVWLSEFLSVSKDVFCDSLNATTIISKS